MRPLARLKAYDGLTPDAVQRPPETNELGDLRFRALMPDADWVALPLPIRRRFSKRLAGGNTAVYVGEVIETQMSRAGWLLAQAARLIGGPLPISRDARTPSVVTVTEDVATKGRLSVTHAELGDGRFLFKLEIIHPRLGRLICQTAAFQEAHP